MVLRVYVEKKAGVSPECDALAAELRTDLQCKNLQSVRIFNRYDCEGIGEDVFQTAKRTVFSEPQTDLATSEIRTEGAAAVFAVEPLPGQFDQRADSAAQCIQMISCGERPLVRSAKVYALYGTITDEELQKIQAHVINPVECRLASMALPETLRTEASAPADIAQIAGFCTMDEKALAALSEKLGLAMDAGDLSFLQAYFREEERREPTMTEVRIVDTYWSDHCRHTTFSTHLDEIEIGADEVKKAYEAYLAARQEVYGAEKAAKRAKTLMDIATIGAKTLKRRGLTPEIDESEEINACSIHVPTVVDGREEDWLLMFKNETHNHPTEIEPFGGAATCIGGCIRDPLSGRAYVHQAMRVTGGGDPRVPFEDTLAGKLPQRKLAVTAAAGYSSYGNQIGLATGHVAELYHEGYRAKRLECGAVVAAAPAENVVRKTPQPGDVVILLGGRTGRDGIGGATGSSKSHNLQSLQTMASEVQKGNAPEERKIQRLFRDGAVTRMIKRCNDFGAGGVAVAVGELADGLEIDLDAVRKKYDGLDGTELAISESQERMAVVVEEKDAAAFIAAAEKENLEAYPIAVVTAQPRMVMRWRGKVICDISRSFLNTNGAVKTAAVRVGVAPAAVVPLHKSLSEMAQSLRSASRRGLTERFDSTVGAGTVLMPFGGKTQRSPSQAMAALFPVLPGKKTEQASLMAWGCDPEQLERNPFEGAKNAVYTSLAKIVAAGADYRKAYLTLQEFFEKLGSDPTRWAKPFSALLGAMQAQLELGAAAIGGKDSMSGTFLDLDVPPTLISFAIAPCSAKDIIGTPFTAANHPVYLFGGDAPETQKAAWEKLHALSQQKKVLAAWAVENGLAEGVMKMSFGNLVGFCAQNTALDWYTPMPGAILAELTEEIDGAALLGYTVNDGRITVGTDSEPIETLLAENEAVLSPVYPTEVKTEEKAAEPLSYTAKTVYAPAMKIAKPKAVIPVFPGTNCEYDTESALLDAGVEAELLVVRNLTAADVQKSVEDFAALVRTAQMVILPGGFSGGDEPDGSAKFITAFFRNPAVKEAVTELLKKRDGLMLGICNGFQALIKLGLVPFGEIREMDENCPTLTFNTIGRHQSRIVHTRVCSNLSPWLAQTAVGQTFAVPVSHGEGRFYAPQSVIETLAKNGQIATQYVDENGMASMQTDANPNGSCCAIEGITSPDGRVFGKMGHVERIGKYLYKNVPDAYDMKLFLSAARYFQK